MSDAAEHFAGELVERVLLPLAIGGALRPLKPIGAQLAVNSTQNPLLARGEGALALERARLGQAQRLLPLDDLPPVGEAEWRMACALSDLLQVTHPDLVGLVGANRPQRMLDWIDQTLTRTAPPATLAEAVHRHATFCRLPELTRVDTHVSWWTGQQQFRGEPPPPRLTAWPKLRRVQKRTERPHLLDLATGVLDGQRARWQESLFRWLDHTPLTRIAAASELPFEWTSQTLALISSKEGRRLALRVVRSSVDPGRLLDALLEGRGELAAPARRVVAQLAADAGLD